MRPMLAVLILLAACTAEPSILPTDAPASRTPPSVAGGPIEPLPPVAGLPYDDPRLDPVLNELQAHPEWLDAPVTDPEILALVPGVDHLCMAMRGTADGDVFVAIDAGEDPWSAASVAIDRGADGREITHDATGLFEDACAYVVLGRRDPWPASADEVDVLGAVAGDEAVAVAQALYARPQEFGIDLHGRPELAVHDVAQPAPDGWRCWRAVVFVSGPRAQLVIGTRQGPAGWEVTSRITRQALEDPAPRPSDGC